MNIDIKANQKEFEDLLRSTGREGIDYVIEDLQRDGFFSAPASAGHHLNCEGGLCEHSLNVYRVARMLWENMGKFDPSVPHEVKEDSIILSALLHDVCKTTIYKPTMKRKKDNTGMWVDVPGYALTYKQLPVGHGEKSVIMLLLSGLELSDEEIMAIRWHMGPFGLNFNSREDCRSYDAARTLSPLVSIIHHADSLAASIIERSAEDLDEL